MSIIPESLGEAILQVKLDSSGLTAGLNAAQAQTTAGLAAIERSASTSGTRITAALGGAMQRSAAMMSAGFAQARASMVGLASGVNLLIGGGLIAFLKNTASESSRAAANMALLDQELRDTGQNVEAGRAKIDQLARSLGVLPDSIADSVTQLLRQGLTIDQIAVAFKGAGASALTFGKSAQTGIDAVTQAIVTQQSTYLNYAGISQNLDVAYKKYAATLGTTVGKLTDLQKAQAAVLLVEQATAKEVAGLPVLMQGLAGAQARVTLEADKARKAFGEGIAPALSLVYNFGAGVLRLFNSLPDSLRGTIATVALVTAGVLALTGAFGLLAPVVINMVGLVKGLGVALVGLVTNPIALAVGAVIGLGVAFVKFGGPVDETKKRLQLLGQAALAVFNVLKGVGQGIIGVAASIGQTLGTLSVAVERAAALDFTGAVDVLKQGINLESIAANFENASQSLGAAKDQFLATLNGDVRPETEALTKSIEGLVSGVNDLIKPVNVATGATGGGGTGLKGFGDALDKASKEGKVTTAQVRALIPEAKKLVLALAEAEASRDPKKIEAASLALDAFTRAHKAGSEAIQQATKILKPYLDQLDDARQKAEALTRAWKDNREAAAFDRYRVELRGYTEEQLKAALANATAAKDVAKLNAVLDEQARRAEEGAEAWARYVDAMRGVLDRRYGDGVLATLDAVQRSEGAFTSLDDALVKLARSGITLTVPLLTELTTRFGAAATAADALNQRIEYQGSRLAGLATDTARAITALVYDALATNDPLNIQAALDKTNAFIASDGFKSIPEALQKAVQDGVPLMQAVLGSAEFRVEVDLDPIFAANTSANTDRLEKWAKDAVGAVEDYLTTDTADLERVQKAIEHSLRFDDLDLSQQQRLTDALAGVKDILGAVATARKGYADTIAEDLANSEAGVLTLMESFEESVRVFRDAQAALAGVGTEAGEAGDIFAGLADEVTTELAPIYEALGEGLGGEFVDGITSGMDADTLAGLLSTVTDEALQELYQRYANSENPIGKLVATLLDEEAGRRADLNLAEGVTFGKPDTVVDYGITPRLNELEGSLSNLDLYGLNEAMAELNGYLALSELDDGVLARVEGLRDRTRELLDLLNGLDFTATGVGQMMADVAPLFEAVGEVFAQGISDALSNPGSFDGAAISDALVTLADDALQDLYAHFATVDNPMGRLVARLIDDEASKRAAARLDEPSVVFPQPDATVDYGITPRLEELERGLHTMSVQELSAALEEMNGWLALPDLDATVLARVQALKDGAQGIVDVWTAFWDITPTQDLTNPIPTAEVEEATDSIEDFREAHRLGLITQEEYARNLEDEIKALEGVSIQTQATRNRIAQLRAELAALTSVTRKVTEGLSAAAGMLQAIDDVSAQGIGRLADTVAGVVSKIASEDYVGAIAQAFTFLVAEVQAAQRETEAFQKSLKDLDKQLLFADRSSVSTVSRERGGFLGLGTKEVLKVDEFALEVANTMEDAVVNGISNGFMEAIRKGDFSLFSENFRKTIGEAVLQGLIDAFIQGEIVKNILGPAVNKWIEARKTPGVEDDIEASKGLDDAVNESIKAGEDFYNQYLVPASQRLGLYGIDREEEPEARNPFGSVNLPSIGIQSAIATPILESAQSFKLSTDALGVHVGVFGAAASLFNAATARFDATITRLEQAAANGTAGLRYA